MQVMTYITDIALVLQRIYEVFPILNIPVIKDPKRYSELEDLQPILENTPWTDCAKDPRLVFELQYGFWFLPPEAQHYYLPALLCYILTSPTSDSIRNEAWGTLSTFLYPPEWCIESVAYFDRRSKLFTSEQLSIIATALIHIKESDPFWAEEIDLMLHNYWFRFLE
jgi:hypothetical protein